MEVISSLIVEVCVDSIQSAVAAINGGANRLEICANLGSGGGTTPSIGLIRTIQRVLPEVPLMVMIRPRIGDFLYSQEELAVMLEDIRIIKELGVRGFVVGALTRAGAVDVEYMRSLVDAVLPSEVCFHRAFDMTHDPVAGSKASFMILLCLNNYRYNLALRQIDEIGGISRVLTSGHRPSVTEGLPVLKQLFKTRKELIEDADWGLTIMPGSGVNSESLPNLLQNLLPRGLKEIHLSGGTWLPSQMSLRVNGMGMGDLDNEWSIWRTVEEEVRKVREIADSHWAGYTASLKS
ncbi:hypothetical protein D9619_002626 [Psilocybe cf. subviscida]|uniref:Copper homeostasis protein cutC homolog n=1 Tax=Psilocybe cf. subviscida TaxID=2480587 RepID=A0A8H5EU47_9AGAR|nr:hypothetical protein D9619_002626 [Psilocybe cf. subviscida]